MGEGFVREGEMKTWERSNQNYLGGVVFFITKNFCEFLKWKFTRTTKSFRHLKDKSLNKLIT